MDNQDKPKKKLLTIQGRATRKEFWISHLTLLIPGIAFLTVGIMMGVALFNECNALLGLIVIAFMGIVGLLLLVGFVAVQIRRFHDRNMSGWFVLLFALLSGTVVAQIVELVILGFLDGMPGANRFGDDPKNR